MAKLTDTQLILLSTAAQRECGSLYPLPDTLAADRVAKAIRGLTGRGLIEEREASDVTITHRANGDQRYGLFITEVGAAAIGVGDGEPQLAAPRPIASSPTPARSNKTTEVLDLLQRPTGATLTELIDATGWLPHTTRAALTGLRKKGHTIERGKRGDATCYAIVQAA